MYDKWFFFFSFLLLRELSLIREGEAKPVEIHLHPDHCPPPDDVRIYYQQALSLAKAGFPGDPLLPGL